jgi:hypothetical protein
MNAKHLNVCTHNRKKKEIFSRDFWFELKCCPRKQHYLYAPLSNLQMLFQKRVEFSGNMSASGLNCYKELPPEPCIDQRMGTNALWTGGIKSLMKWENSLREVFEGLSPNLATALVLASEDLHLWSFDRARMCVRWFVRVLTLSSLLNIMIQLSRVFKKEKKKISCHPIFICP